MKILIFSFEIIFSLNYLNFCITSLLVLKLCKKLLENLWTKKQSCNWQNKNGSKALN